MPIYNYLCEEEHIHSDFRDVQARLDAPDCKTCGKASAITLRENKKPESEKSNGIRVRYRHGKPKHIFHFRDAICQDCKEESFVDCTNEETNEYSRDGVECEHCGSKDLEILPACHNIDRFSERFPYYDRGLGMMLTSKAHRREMCKKLGVSPLDGDMDHMAGVKAAQEKEREDKAVVNKLKHRFENHPGYAEYRQMKDRGWKPKFKHRRQ